MRTLDGLDVAGRRVIVRADLNVPIHDGVIADDLRIQAAVPTLRRLLTAGASIVVLSHLGRPAGQAVPQLSLAPVASRLTELFDAVTFVPDTAGPAAREAARALRQGQILVLENVRFDPRETAKADAERGELASAYAQLGEAFVSDGFGVLHRKQASVVDIAHRLPSVAGELVRSEVAVLQRLTEAVQRPYVVVLGGAKVADKLAVIANLVPRVDRILIGGGMAFTFLAAQGYSTGTSLLEPDMIDTVREVMRQANESGVEIVLPIDFLAAQSFAADAVATKVTLDTFPDDQMGLDIGPESAARFASALADAGTIFWNGPMGVFEFAAFASGTRVVAEAVANAPGFSVVGGGDSAAAVRSFGMSDGRFGHISTGGGASLEYLEGKTLPGLAVLNDEG